MAEKVIDPAKRVTDATLLERLVEQGIDKDYVEFTQDYAPRSLGKEHSPYAKFYRDLKSNKRFMVVSGLPKVKPDGTKIEVGWVKSDNKYEAKPNLFSAVIVGTQVKITCLSDQPSGTKKNDKITWQPQLFLDDVEQICSKVALLDVDPTNQFCHQNVLEWDYGICKRRIRIIEGRIKEKWIFDSNPIGEVKIKHNISGNLPLKLGRGRDSGVESIQVQVDGDTEIISIEEFNRDGIVYPVEVGASPETFYPAIGTGGDSVDGILGGKYANGSGVSWATIKADSGNYALEDGEDLPTLGGADEGSPDYRFLYRPIVTFPTDALPDGATVTAATYSEYGKDKDNTIGTPARNVFSAAPANLNALVNGDYDSLGTTPYCDTAITYAAFNVGTPGTINNYAFNATGLAAISNPHATPIGLRDTVFDVGVSTPTWAQWLYYMLRAWSTDKGNGYKPKLVVTYTTVTFIPRITGII